MELDATLSRELMELTSVVKKMVRHEFTASAGANTPTLTQFRMLHQIRQGVNQVGLLAAALGITQPATSIMVNTMVRQGFLRRVAHPQDRRRLKLCLTAAATVQLETGYQRAMARIEGRFASLSPARKAALARQIHEVAGLLSGPGAPGPHA